MKSSVRSLCILVLVCLTTISSTVWADTIPGRVVSVSDGDTVNVLDADKVLHKIRLAGIDAPEKQMPFGNRAKELLSDLVFNKDVIVDTKKVDRYGRRVGKILVNGRNANLAMISGGLAWHYKAYQQEQTAAARSLYSDAEDRARGLRLGLWGDRDPVAPWEWRKLSR